MNNANIQIIAIDMDGTVLNEQKQISERTKNALQAAANKGVLVVPATGRAANGVPKELMEFANVQYAITANGARVLNVKTGECLVERLMPKQDALIAFDLLQKYDCMLDAFQDGIGYSTAHNLVLAERLMPPVICAYVKSTRTCVPDLRAFVAEQPQGIEKWSMFFGTEEERVAAKNEMNALGLFEVVSSLPLNLELSAKGVNKGMGLSVLAKKLQIPLEQVMACGDGGNDLEMIRTAGLGVAMQNGTERVKQAAQYITATNEQDGVALAVEKFVLDVQ